MFRIRGVVDGHELETTWVDRKISGDEKGVRRAHREIFYTYFDRWRDPNRRPIHSRELSDVHILLQMFDKVLFTQGLPIDGGTPPGAVN